MVTFPSLEVIDLETLNAPISVAEVEKAIESLKVNKAPGPDGYKTEFYKQYKDVLSKKLQKDVLQCIGCKKVPTSWTEGRIVLIPKPDKDLAQVKSYRPIMLLNINYNLLQFLRRG